MHDNVSNVVNENIFPSSKKMEIYKVNNGLDENASDKEVEQESATIGLKKEIVKRGSGNLTLDVKIRDPEANTGAGITLVSEYLAMIKLNNIRLKISYRH